MKEINKILIIVPHQDDEINIAGNLIASVNNTENIFIMYTTNGDFIVNAKHRYKEAVKSLKILGNVKREHIFFLGYSDQAYDQDTHMYNMEENWISNKGISQTYAPKGFEEWNYYKYKEHCMFNKNNFTRNIKEVIEDILPDIIVCIDLDFHPDHIMTSLCFEKAMGEILNKKNNNYFPKVLKTFAYENSYLGPKDFNLEEDYGMQFEYNKDGYLKNNPYYNINNSIIFQSNPKCYTKNLLKNIIYKSIKCHNSQVLVGHADSIINANAVYWKRRTKNILYNAKILVSSGNGEYLRDFLLADTNNVLHGDKMNIEFNEGIWIPEKDDNKKEINIILDNKQCIDSMILYNGRCNKNYIKDIELEFDNNKKTIKLKNDIVNRIIIDEECTFIKIKILDKEISNGFSEIELLGKNDDDKRDMHQNNFLNTKFSEIFIKINKIIIKKDLFLQKVYRKIFIR